MKRLLTKRRNVNSKETKHPIEPNVQTPLFITNYLTDMQRSDREYAPHLLHEEPSRKVDIWMPMYWADYYKDTMHLSCLEHGAYFQLIGNYWVRQGPLPDDDVRLSNMTQLTLEEWAPIRKVLEPFFQIGGGLWRHKRIDAELLSAQANRAAESQRQRDKALKRWGKDAAGNAGAMPRHCPSPVPSPASTPLTTPPSLTGLVVQAPEALSREGEAVFEDMTEQQFIDYLEDLFGKTFMAKHGGSWRLRIRENKPKVMSVVREVRSMQREGKRIQSAGACANDLWQRFAN